MKNFLIIMLGVALFAVVYFWSLGFRQPKDAVVEPNRKTEANEPAVSEKKDAEETTGPAAESPIASPKLTLDSPRAIAEALQEFETQMREGNFAVAKDRIDAIVAAKPDELQYQLALADTLFFTGEFATSVAAYDRAVELSPAIEPQLWQRGLAQFYANQFSDGVKQFEVHQRVNSQDVENSVWHLLCEANLSDLKTARKKMIDIQADSRVPMREVFEMFAGRMTPEEVLQVAESELGVVAGSRSHRLHRYYGYLYVALYQELLGEHEASLANMKKAVEVCPLPRGNFMGEVARVHLKDRTQSRLLSVTPAG